MVAGPSGCRSVGSFCGPIPTVTSSDDQSISSPRQNPPGRAGGVGAFMNGIIGPFMACWQPPIAACVSPSTSYGCGAMGPVVSPSSPVDRSPQATTNIRKPHPNDVLCGRGGATNAHTGNLNFRALVAANKEVYVTLTKKQKMLMARAIVNTVHRQEPPGRFLQKDAVSGTWFDIGLPRSLEKTSQALREKTAADKAAASAVDDRDGSEAGSRTPDPTTPPNSAPSSPVSTHTPIRSTRSGSNIDPPEIIIPDHLEAQFNPQLARRRMSAYPDYPPRAAQPYLPNFTHDPRKQEPQRGYDYSGRYGHPGGHRPPPPHHASMYQQPPPHYGGPDYRDHRPMRGPTGPIPPPPPPCARMQPPQPYPHKTSMSSPVPSSPTTSSVVTPDYGGSPPRLGAPQVSPGRRQEWKRRRASEDSSNSAIRVPDSGSASSLHRDMQTRLSFREPQSSNDMVPPSTVLQSRSRRSIASIRGAGMEQAPRSQGLSGLDALSNAALLKLSEER